MGELRRTGPEHLFVLPAVRLQHTRKRANLSIGDACLYFSYEELLEHAEDICKAPYLGASKWEVVNGKWDQALFEKWQNAVSGHLFSSGLR